MSRQPSNGGPSDASLTGLAGLAALDEVIAGLGTVAALDAGIEPIRQRARGLTVGQLPMGMATVQLAGQDCLARLDRVRADASSALLTEAPVAPSTTAGSLAGRFWSAQLTGIETALKEFTASGWRACPRRCGCRWSCGIRRSIRTPPTSRCKAGASSRSVGPTPPHRGPLFRRTLAAVIAPAPVR